MGMNIRGTATAGHTKVARAMALYLRDADNTSNNYKGEAIGFIPSNLINSVSSTIATALVGAEGANSATPTAYAMGNIAEPMLTATLAHLPDALKFALTGTQTTLNSADASGDATISNLLNSSVVNAATGIASIAITDASLVNAEFLIVEAKTATTVDVFLPDSPLPIESGVAVVASGTTYITKRGLRLTGGSGTIGMTAGDQAIIETRPKNRGYTEWKPDFSLPPKQLVVDVISQWQPQSAESNLININQQKTTFLNCTVEGSLLQFNGSELTPYELNFKLAREEAQDSFFTQQQFSRIA